MSTDLVRTEARQADLFFGPDVRRERGMDVLDKIKDALNKSFGDNSARFDG